VAHSDSAAWSISSGSGGILIRIFLVSDIDTKLLEVTTKLAVRSRLGTGPQSDVVSTSAAPPDLKIWGICWVETATHGTSA
jgi:hypothetical protein